MSTPITASTRATYDEKVAIALKTDYKPGDTVDLAAFKEKYQVKSQTVKRVLEAHPELGLLLPVSVPTVANGR